MSAAIEILYDSMQLCGELFWWYVEVPWQLSR